MNQRELLSIPAQEYHAAEGVSASMLDQIRKSPAHLKCYMDGELREESDALSLGTLIHRAVLEPETWDDAFYVKPEGMKFSNKEGMAWRDEHKGKPIIEASEATIISRVRDAVWKEPAVRALLSGGYAEQSLFVEDEHGTLRKSRFDYIATSGNVIPDIKTTKCAAIADFEKSIERYSYFQRAAFYLDNANLAGMQKDAFVFICVETVPPYLVALYQLNDTVLEAGRMLYRRDLQLYRNCVESNRWPGYHEGIREIALPSYAMRQLEEVL